MLRDYHETATVAHAGGRTDFIMDFCGTSLRQGVMQVDLIPEKASDAAGYAVALRKAAKHMDELARHFQANSARAVR